MQAYSDPAREEDAYSLPDVEVFYVDAEDFLTADDDTWMADYMNNDPEYRKDRAQEALANELAGWYYWYCFPGCLPDSDPVGPFATEAAALADAQEGSE